jgi:DNA-binding winged helix-turn-helix (wHTH) protein
VLVAHAGRVVTRGRLLRAVWGTAYSEEAHYIHVYVSQIRRKLSAADPQGLLERLIVAEPGVGYRIALLDSLEEPERFRTLPATTRQAPRALPPRAGTGR